MNGRSMRRAGTPRGLSARIRTWSRSWLTRSRAGGGRQTATTFPTCGDGDVATRSKRLAALLYLYRGEHPDPLQFKGELHSDELEALADLTEEDRYLANACLEAERALLDREWEAAGLLLERGMFGEDEADAAMDQAIQSGNIGAIAGEVAALLSLGWLD